MKINDAISKCDNIYPNTISNGDKVDLLSQLDGSVKAEIFDKYASDEEVEFSGYTEDTSMDTALLVPFPFDNIYVSWLVAHMYLLMDEHGKYNDWLLIFNSEWDSFARYYAQTHVPKAPDHFTYF